MHRQLIAIMIGSIGCILMGAQPTLGQDATAAETATDPGAAIAGDGTSTAIVRVVTEPEFADGGTFMFTGVPGGSLVLGSGGQGSLNAEGLAAGNQVSKLSQIDPGVEAAGYMLTDIRCDDQDSLNPSDGKLESSAAIFRIEESETVTCVFELSKRGVVGSGGSGTEDLCPKEGRWNAQNLEGKMDCRGAFVMNRKLKPVRDNGVILVMEDDCSVLFGDSTTKKEEDALMTRVGGNLYKGTIGGEEEGIEMVIEVFWTIVSRERITGEMTSSTSQMGMTCDLYRPFEMTFDEALSEGEYQKWEKRIRKKMNQKK